jgi:hypothetical protein
MSAFWQLADLGKSADLGFAPKAVARAVATLGPFQTVDQPPQAVMVGSGRAQF